ncbi:hypothetical protein BRD56_05080 [Thermoplasmatales archaeon SW_10_69_26]|nr:MAG: hypothetical protein BRD56_05080 [Thermoplasmatales archaeon SW_10_69_26]
MPEPEGSENGDASGAPDPVADLEGLTRPIRSFHADHPVYFWMSLLASLAAVLVAGAWLWPEQVVDQFLWKHFWGPTETDARQVASATRNGVQATTSYTLLSELVYGVILAGALVSIYQHLFKKRGIRVDATFIASLLPYVFFGPLARAMEDASVFCTDATLSACDPGVFAYLFISPIIYMVTAAAVITHLLLAHASRDLGRSRQTQVVGAWLGVQAAAYAFVYYAMRDQFVIMLSPWTVLGLGAAGLGLYLLVRSRGGSHLHSALAGWGVPMTGIPIVLVGEWIRSGQELAAEGASRVGWLVFENQGQAMRVLDKATPEILLTTALLTVAVLVLVAGIAYLLEGRFKEAGYFLVPLNLGLIAAHMVDAWATFAAICSRAAGTVCSGAAFLGLDIPPYSEKHPVSEVFLGFLDGWGFPMMKLLLVVAIVILVDRAQYEDEEDPDLIGLVKLAVLVLGLGPGLRNAVRVAMGL